LEEEDQVLLHLVIAQQQVEQVEQVLLPQVLLVDQVEVEVTKVVAQVVIKVVILRLKEIMDPQDNILAVVML
jgi:hypothetical protein